MQFIKRLFHGPALETGYKVLRARKSQLPAKVLIFRLVKMDDVLLSCELIFCITKEFPYIYIWNIPPMVELYIHENADKILKV